MKIRQSLRKLNWFLSSQFGLNIRRFLRSLRNVFRYMRDWKKFRGEYSGRMNLMPCLHDWYEEGGATKSEYFWQDLMVARMVHRSNPVVHVDIGSRIDGFVAHVASFREIEVFDVRPVTSEVPGIVFRCADLAQESNELAGYDNYCDSLSCLHALEHFGLGRYGDEVSSDGFARGLHRLSRFLKPEGMLYLSVPVGLPRVEFNAHRISDPRKVIELADKSGMELMRLNLISQKGSVDIVDIDEESLELIANEEYHLGLFAFTKRCQE